MAEKLQCVRCGRMIDAIARVCPYCNIDRTGNVSVAPPPVLHDFGTGQADPTTETPTMKQISREARTLLMVVGAIALMVATFAIGGLYYRIGNRPSKSAQDGRDAPVAEIAQVNSDTPDLMLTSEPGTGPSAGRIVTTAPSTTTAEQIPGDIQRRDATAMPSTQYSTILEQARSEERSRAATVASVDPRSISTSPFPVTVPPRPRRQTAPPVAATENSETRRDSQSTPTGTSSTSEDRPVETRRTSPVPSYQPLPKMSRREIVKSGSVRLNLTIGADGTVKEVDILETIPNVTPKMIAAVQRWRFKPATENGRPVEGTYLADIFFKANEDD